MSPTLLYATRLPTRSGYILCNLTKVPLIFGCEVPLSTHILEGLEVKDDAVVPGISGAEYSNMQ